MFNLGYSATIGYYRLTRPKRISRHRINVKALLALMTFGTNQRTKGVRAKAEIVASRNDNTTTKALVMVDLNC